MSLSLNTQGFPLDLLHCAKLPKKNSKHTEKILQLCFNKS